MTRRLIVVDVETTGLDPAQHHVLEVAAVDVTDGRTLHFVPALSSTTMARADLEALRINRYIERGLYRDQLEPETTRLAYLQLWEWLDGNTLGGCNPAFDAAMLMRGAQVVNAQLISNEPFPPPRWHHRLADLSAYHAGKTGRSPSEMLGLADLCAELDVVNKATHSALGDAQATAACFRRLMAKETR